MSQHSVPFQLAREVEKMKPADADLGNAHPNFDSQTFQKRFMNVTVIETLFVKT